MSGPPKEYAVVGHRSDSDQNKECMEKLQIQTDNFQKILAKKNRIINNLKDKLIDLGFAQEAEQLGG